MADITALLSEVKPTLAANLAVRAADQIYNGDRANYTNVQPTAAASTSNAAAPARGEQGSRKKGNSNSEQQGSPLERVKKVVDDALHGAAPAPDNAKYQELEKKFGQLQKEVEKLSAIVKELQLKQTTTPSAAAAAPKKEEPKKEEKEAADDEDIDLFGSDDEEDEEKARVTAERLKAYAEKKSKKPGPIAKSSIILDVKPWDDETNMEELEQLVRSIEMDGLVWGGGKLLPIGYGIRKLQIIVVVEDEKVSVDDIIDKCTTDFDSHIQSVDIVAFNKI